MIFYLFIFTIGACIGSFIGAFAYRYPLEIPISKGRSFCPSCKKQIAWYDNIPLLSFILLSGKCRNCKRKISFREPLIEFGTATTFLVIALLINSISINLEWTSSLFVFQLPFLLVLASLLIAIFIIDLENQVIPDELVFVGLFLTLLGFLETNSELIFPYMLAGFGASLALLFLHGVTKGRGMGLGDVKLALFIGTLLGFSNSVVWLFSSFFVGGLYGFVVIALGKAKLKQKLPFAPFLIVGLIITLFLGVNLKKYVYPWL